MSAFDPRYLRQAIKARMVQIMQFGILTATNVQDALEQIIGFLAGKHDKTGFDVDATGAYTCTLTYNETTRTVTLTPLNGTFDIYIQGTKYTKTTQSLSHPATDANHFFYFDETGTFVTSTTPWDVLIHAPACFVFQDATNNRRIPFEERHHAGRDTYWHKNQHFAEGTKTIAGFAATDITGYTLATGTDAACTFAIASGTIADEDIQVVSEVLPDNGPYNILERNGVAGAWQLTRTNTVPFKRSGTTLQYNQNNAGTWQLTTVANGDHVNYYVFAVTALPITSITPNPSATQQIVIVPSQQKFTNLVTAHSENVSSLAWGTIPFQEIVPIYKLIFKYSSAAGGTISLEQVDKIVGSAVSLSSSAPTDHGSLTGLSDLDHPASAIINTPAGNIAATTVQAAINELDSEKLAIASLGTGIQTFLATPSSANLASAITDEIGSSSLVFSSALGKNNLIINPFEINQRGLTSVADDAYCLDRWYVLTDGGNITVAQITDPETGAPWAIRLTQPDVSAKRFGLATIIESKDIRALRSASVNLSMRVKPSFSGNIRYAILEHTGTADSVTSDVVNNWASTTYTPSNFFIASVNVIKTGIINPGAATYGDLSDFGTFGASLNNCIIFIWTEGTAAQNATLELNRPKLEAGVTKTDFVWRQHELSLCNRYFEVVDFGITSPSTGLAGAGVFLWQPYTAPKRVTPTVGIISVAYSNGSGLTIDNISAKIMRVWFTQTAAGAAQTGGSLSINSEL